MVSLSLEEGGEGGAEGLAGAVEAEFDGFGGGLGDGGDLVVAEVFVGGEDEGFALVLCGEMPDKGFGSRWAANGGDACAERCQFGYC
jgi:hypothetical protein